MKANVQKEWNEVAKWMDVNFWVYGGVSLLLVLLYALTKDLAYAIFAGVCWIYAEMKSQGSYFIRILTSKTQKKRNVYGSKLTKNTH